MNFLFTYHPVWLILAVGIAFLYAFFLYRKDELLEETKRAIKLMLAAFRFLAVFGILLLLLGIIIEKFNERKEKPLVFIVNDNSASILLSKDSTYYQTTFLNDLEAFSSTLSDKFDVQDYSFATSLSPGFNSDFDGKSTDLSVVFNSIFDQYTNRNIGGIVLASDGIYNAGGNPLYSIARKSFLPVFTIGLGDTNLVRDVRLEKVNHNDIAFLGNEFPVEIDLSETMCEGESVNVKILDGDKTLATKTLKFNGERDQATLSFILQANRIGYRKFTAEISAVAGEYSLKNNSANFYIEIIDGRQKILIANKAPHPDIGALQYVIEKNKNYEVTVSNIKEATELNKYDLIIIHNYEKSNNKLNEYIEQGKGPVLFLVGTEADFSGLTDLKIGFSGRATSSESVQFSYNSNFKDILLSSKGIQVFSAAPPLEAPFGNINFSKAIDIMAYQKVGNISLNQPLIYFSQKRNSRFGVIMGDGIWRWRLYDQMKNRTTENFEALFSKIINYLAVKENKDPFRIQLNKEYTENEEIIVNAELYNKSFDRVNEPEVSFNYQNENGEKFESFFVRNSEAYQLNLGRLKQGVYEWTASTTFQEDNFVKKGTFIVREVKIEYLNTVADHRLLRSIADNSAGEFYFPNQLDDLERDILSRDDMVTVVYKDKEFDDLIDYKWLFILIVLLFSVEWFVRKYQGAY